MTMTENSTLVTVYHACDPVAHKEHVAGAPAPVVESKPTDSKLVFELHVPRELLTESKKGMTIDWTEAMRWPYQVTAV